MKKNFTTKLKALIFDFDGVICESVEGKTEAFRKLFLDYPEQLDEIMHYHIVNGGISRYIKFQHIYDNIIKEKLSKARSQELGRLFTEYAFEGVVDSVFVKGAEEFLKKYYQKVSLFIISGTPEDELMDIVKARRIKKYFKGIYGTPRKKGELTKFIIKENGFSPRAIAFVGDAINDYHGAKEANIRFIGRVHQGYDNPFEDLPSVDLVNDLAELELLLSKENLL